MTYLSKEAIDRWQEVKDHGGWGAKNGLLSATELATLAYWSFVPAPEKMLEIGHYHGLSTHCISSSKMRGSEFVTIDAHIRDGWVPETEPEVYFANARKWGIDASVLIMDSRAIKRLDGFDWLFYDGDHAEEQLRFIKMAHESESMRTILFDDADFDVPAQCCEFLEANGWERRHGELTRTPADKMDPETNTIAIYTR